MRPPLSLLSLSLLAACSASQQPHTSDVAHAFRSGDLCAIDIVTSSPSVHGPASFLSGSARSLSTSRFYLPALDSSFTPASVRTTSIDEKGRETSTPWRLGTIGTQGKTVTIELFEKSGETLIPWAHNGTYALVGADACR